MGHFQEIWSVENRATNWSEAGQGKPRTNLQEPCLLAPLSAEKEGGTQILNRKL